MARKKVKLAFIENSASRKATLSKGIHGILKKTHEISVLCDVDACAIIYGKDDQIPVVWPPSEAEVRRIISNYKKKPQIDQTERQLDQQSLLKQIIKKTEEKLERMQRKNREMQIENMITDIMTGKSTLEQVAPCDLGDLISVLEKRMKSVEHRLRVFNWGNDCKNPCCHGDNPNMNPNRCHGDGIMVDFNSSVRQTLPWYMEPSTSRNNHTSE